MDLYKILTSYGFTQDTYEAWIYGMDTYTYKVVIYQILSSIKLLYTRYLQVFHLYSRYLEVFKLYTRYLQVFKLYTRYLQVLKCYIQDTYKY